MKLNGLALLAFLASASTTDSVLEATYCPRLLLWNRLDSKDNVKNSEVGPPFRLISYKIADWEEAYIGPAKFGNGTNVGQCYDAPPTSRGTCVDDNSWDTDDANFVAVNLHDVGLTPERGTIEFWFRFGFDSSTSSHALFLATKNELVEHYHNASLMSTDNTSMTLTWSGWESGGAWYGNEYYCDWCAPRKHYYWTFWNEQWDNVTSLPPCIRPWADKRNRLACTPMEPEGCENPVCHGAAGPGGSLEFNKDEDQHFALVWDIDGIDEASNDTMRLYVNGTVAASSTEEWNGNLPFKRWLYLGSFPNWEGRYSHYHHGINGMYDNIKIWSFAKTDTFNEGEEPGVADQQAPSILCSVERNLTNKDVAFNVDFEVTDNCAIDESSAQLYVCGTSFPVNKSELVVLRDLCGNTNFRGTIKLNVSATDESGNSATKSCEALIDTKAPKAFCSIKKEKKTNDAVYRIEFGADDNTGDVVVETNLTVCNQTVEESTSGDFVNLTSTCEEDYGDMIVLNVLARDSNGNIDTKSCSQKIKIKVKKDKDKLKLRQRHT